MNLPIPDLIYTRLLHTNVDAYSSLQMYVHIVVIPSIYTGISINRNILSRVDVCQMNDVTNFNSDCIF